MTMSEIEKARSTRKTDQVATIAADEFDRARRRAAEPGRRAGRRGSSHAATKPTTATNRSSRATSTSPSCSG